MERSLIERANMSQKPQPRSSLSRIAAKGNGRVQRQCRRALLVHGTISSRNTLNRATRRALASIGAVKVGRAATVGRPWLWEMR
jgi:hypothetical protein